MALSQYAMIAFGGHAGNPAAAASMRSFFRRHDLLAELTPAEHTYLLDGREPSQAQTTDATWRSEAVYALRWAIGDRQALPVGGQVSLMQALPTFENDDEIRAMLAGRPLRPEEELRRALELFFAVHWRLQLRRHGVERLDFARWIEDSPTLSALRPGDVPLIDGDLSLDAAVMQVAAADLGVDSSGGWPAEGSRVPIHACTPRMLDAGDNLARVVTERLRALRWLFGVTAHLDQEPPGVYSPYWTAARDKAVLYGAETATEKPTQTAAQAEPARHDAHGGVASHRAAWRGDVVALHEMLDGGPDMPAADMPTVDIDGDYAVHCAILGDQTPALRVLLAHDPFGSFYENADGAKPLHLAAARGAVDAIDALAADAADDRVSVPDAHGDTALVHAIRGGQAPAVRRLLDLGVRLDGALDATIQHDRPDMIRCLAEHGIPIDEVDGNVTLLYFALFEDHRDCAATLLDLGADATFVHESGTTTLQLAANNGATELCRRLLDGGADLDRRLNTMSAVHFAILSGHTECAMTLIDRGADVTGCDQSLMSLAERGGSVPLMQWCLDRGEAPGELRGWAGAGRADVLAALIAAGAPAEGVDGAGITPLQVAADRGRLDCVDVLLAAGAAVDLVSADRGLSALHLAAMHGHDDCVRALLGAGASPDMRDASGKTAYDWAVSGNHEPTVALLTGPSPM